MKIVFGKSEMLCKPFVNFCKVFLNSFANIKLQDVNCTWNKEIIILSGMGIRNEICNLWKIL
jgi:hypothetical protein